MTEKKVREDLDAATTDRKGVGGVLEFLIRKFRVASFIIALIPLYLVSTFSMAVSIAPGILFFNFMSDISSSWPPFWHYIALGCGVAFGYFFYGATVPWYFHNALTYLVRYTFLEFVTPTPLNTLFYKMMGMKIGKGSHINTTNISDPCMIEIGEKVTIGGSATLIAHYASQGYLVVDKVKIGNKATIGLKATVFEDVEIGEDPIIAPHEVILPKSRIPEGRR
jgi:hypothetical protein